MSDTERGPNPISAGWSVVRSLSTVARPRPRATTAAASVDHSMLGDVLGHLKGHGVQALPDHTATLTAYRDAMAAIDPDGLGHAESLAYWLNLYNAGALLLAAEADATGKASVLRVPGGFSRDFVTIAGSMLSLDAIEHAKIRRFKDPRIHGALVCGSASCPTLRFAPYTGAELDAQLDRQMSDFFARGGAVVDGDRVLLSRILLWFGGDFVRPRRMPSLLPASKTRVAVAVQQWLPGDVADALAAGAAIEFQPYDWALACAIQ